MAELVITAANVAKGSGANVITAYNAGETITAGMSVYLKSSDSEWYKAQCDGTAEESGSGVSLGVALHGSLNGQPLAVQTSGQITIGATVAIGEYLVVGTTAGAIMLTSDLASTNKVSYIGYPASTTVVQLDCNGTGLAKA